MNDVKFFKHDEEYINLFFNFISFLFLNMILVMENINLNFEIFSIYYIIFLIISIILNIDFYSDKALYGFKNGINFFKNFFISIPLMIFIYMFFRIFTYAHKNAKSVNETKEDIKILKFLKREYLRERKMAAILGKEMGYVEENLQ
jgi:hypothetical protein